MEHTNKINSKEFKKIANPHTKIVVKPGPKKETNAKHATNYNINQNQGNVNKNNNKYKLKNKKYF
jgi:hypothetical protein